MVYLPSGDDTKHKPRVMTPTRLRHNSGIGVQVNAWTPMWVFSPFLLKEEGKKDFANDLTKYIFGKMAEIQDNVDHYTRVVKREKVKWWQCLLQISLVQKWHIVR